MKFLIKLFLTLVLLVVIVVGGAAAYLYFSFVNPTPAEYAHISTADQVTSIELAEISFENGIPQPTGIGVITDKEAFLADLDELQCYKGLDLNSLDYWTESKSVEGIVIHYADGSSEIITAYVSINKKDGQTSLFAADGKTIYSFNPEEFSSMLDEYKDLYITEGSDKIPGLDGIEIPDDFEIPDDLEIPGLE